MKLLVAAYTIGMKKISAMMIMTLAFSFTGLYAANQPDWARMVDAAGLVQSVKMLKPEAAQVQAALAMSQLPPVPGIKLALNDQEKKKFLELAEYAQKLTDVKIDSGWISERHFFQLRGSFAADGSYYLDGFILMGRSSGFMPVHQFQISSNGLIDKYIGSYNGPFYFKTYNRESVDGQAMLSKEIAYWMSYQVPK